MSISYLSGIEVWLEKTSLICLFEFKVRVREPRMHVSLFKAKATL